MAADVDLSVLEPFTGEEIEAYIAYLWTNGAIDVAAAVVGALRDSLAEPAPIGMLPMLDGRRAR